MRQSPPNACQGTVYSAHLCRQETCYTNFKIWSQGSAFRNFVLQLSERLPVSRFVLILISHFDDDILAKTIGRIQGLGFKFEVLLTPPDKEELLRVIRA